MKTSETISKLAPALVKAQGAIKPAIKDATNPAFRSKYADLSAVWEAVRETLSENGLAVAQLPVHAEDGHVHLTTRLIHTSGEWIEETASIPVAKRDAHGFGSAYTYLRRYMLSALLGVVADEDDDANEAVKASGADRPSHAKQAATDAFDELDEEKKAYLHREAVKIIAMLERDEDAGSYIASQIKKGEYDMEIKLALWSLLPSDARSKIKEQEKTRKTAPKPSNAELATQP